MVSRPDSREASKRKRRKQPNDKNKWPQHPKIQAMDVRNKAYIRVAGLGSTAKKKKELLDPTLDLHSPEVKFGRLLGGTDQRKRHMAVLKLQDYLRARCDITEDDDRGISELDLLKLWKGLWYTLYMADKVPVQDELSKRLAGLIWCLAGTDEEDECAGQAYMNMCEEDDAIDEEDDDESDVNPQDGLSDWADWNDEDVTIEELVNNIKSLPDDIENSSSSEDSGVYDEESSNEGDEEVDGDTPDDQMDSDMESLDDAEIPHCRGAHLASLFIRTYFRTLRREWSNMDKYRIDKFYTLTRLVMHEVYKYMATRHWNIGIVRLFNDCIFEEVLKHTPNGLRYHLIDVTMEELAKVNKTAPMQLTEATFLDVVEPYLAMAQSGANDSTGTVQTRVMDNILNKFIDQYSVVSEGSLSQEESPESLVMQNVHVGTVSDFIFAIASDPETKDRYRKSLYDMHKKYARRLKKVGRDVQLHHDENEEWDGPDDGEQPEDLLETIERAELDEQEEHANAPPDNNSSLERKRKAEKESVVATGTCAEDESPKRRRKREKKSSKSTAKTDKVIDRSLGKGVEEEEITISVAEQRRAKKLASKLKKSTPSKKEGPAKIKSKVSPPTRKVTFSPVNRSKSHHDSMRGLRSTKPPRTSEASPSKSILLPGKRGAPTSKQAFQKSSRKKASSYFKS